MKSIIIFRHAKSDWEAGFQRDHDRPINKRGRKDARTMGKFLAEIDFLPDRIVSSTAVRARTTLERASDEGSWGSISTELTDALYEASAGDVLNLIRAQEDEFSRLLLVGHEPTWSTLVGRLIGSASVKMSTASMARVDVDSPTWMNVDFGLGELRWLVPPKLLRAAFALAAG